MEDLTPAWKKEREREGAIVIVELHNNTFLGALALLLSYLSSFLAKGRKSQDRKIERGTQ